MRGIFLLVVSTAILVAGCGQTTEADLERQRTYRHAMDQAPNNLDPVRAATVYANFIVLNAYDTLYGYRYLARPYTLKPNLAVDLPEISDDGLTYTIRLKQGVHFIDDPAFEGGVGREVTAQDFVYSLKRHFDPTSRSQGAWLYQGRIVGLDEWKDAGSDYDRDVEGLRAIDDHTIEIRLVRPYPQLVHALAQGFAAVVPREAVDKYGLELSIHPVGSGPFRVESFNTARAILVANPVFRKEPVDLAFEGYDASVHAGLGLETLEGRTPPFVDRVEIQFIAEDAARWNSFTKGSEAQYTKVPTQQFDFVLSSNDPPALNPEAAGKYHMLALVAPEVIFNAFNMDDEEFGYNADPEREERNKALRCAMIRAFDWDDRSRRFYNDLAKIFPGIIPPAVPEFDPDMPRDSVTRNVEEARRLLADAGWNEDNLPQLTYGFASSVKQRQFYEQFRGFMAEAGYPKEKIVAKPFANFGDISKAWKQSELPLVSKSWGLDFPDAENVLQLFYGPNGSPGSNDANYANPEYDELYARAAVMQPGAERTGLYRRMNRMLVDDCVAMMGLSRTNLLMWHKDVIAFPDRNVVGGFFLRYVDLIDPPASPARAD